MQLEMRFGEMKISQGVLSLWLGGLNWVKLWHIPAKVVGLLLSLLVFVK
jgi:hypothetical protein